MTDADVSDDRAWSCIRCHAAVSCAFCESCAIHCATLRPNALQAHRRGGKIVVAPWPRFELANEDGSQAVSALLAEDG